MPDPSAIDRLARALQGVGTGFANDASRWAGNAGQWLGRGAQSGIDDMAAALSGYRVPQGAVLTDAGYVMPETLAQGRYDSALEREPDTMRALTLIGGAMSPARGAGIAAKAGTEAKAAVTAANALPMDEASRMARAQKMGYTVEAYHGTTSDPGYAKVPPRTNDIREFSTVRVNHLNEPVGVSPISFAAHPERANSYAEGVFGLTPADPTVYPVKLRLGNNRVIDAQGAKFKNIGGKHINQHAEEARAAGFDSLTVNNVVDAGGPADRGVAGTTYMVFDPGNIRSRFAVFDPAKAGSADILASSANVAPLLQNLLSEQSRR